ncbi:hypothetical protein FRC04_007303 [Tulasnella sp. 424]|nr:hypothetical protein FRC04_007303 [Tulasnella sp. 424]KAG8976231.1 hypothetical protein FRC05_004481 [Tulasnella sp. 425]
MPRVPSATYFPYHHHQQHERSSPYRNNSLQLPVPNTRSSPSPSTYSHRSSHYASSSTASPPHPLSPLPAPPRQQSTSWTAQGELYPYIKGKKVTNSQLNQLLVHFAENENPSKEQRLALANQLCMSFKALSIWFQNERANVKKGRSRAVNSTSSPSPVAAQPPSPPETHQHLSHHQPLPTPPSSVSKPPPSTYYRSHPLHPPTTFISSRRPLPLALRPVTARLSPQPAISPISSSRGGFPSPYATSEYYYEDEHRHDDSGDDELESEDGSTNRTAVDFESPASESHRLPEVRVHPEPIIVQDGTDDDEIIEIENPHRQMDIVEWEAATILAGLKAGSR